MATSTEIAIATTTLGTAASTITFSSIPSTYTDLRLIFITTTSINGANINLRFNSDTGTNYSSTWLEGNGTSASSYRATNDTRFQLTNGAGTTTIPSFTILDIFNYAGSTYKTALDNVSGDTNGSGYVFRSVQMWRSTSAINRIDLTPTSGNFNAGTTATLYGIA